MTFAARAVELTERLADAIQGSSLATAAADLRAELPAEPDATEMARFNRLISGYGLSAFECDLVTLSGLANEHEIIATTLAELHPSGHVAPTPALAAAVLCHTSLERPWIRRALTSGPLIEHGIVRTDNATFFRRSLTLAPTLWETLRGFDAWPSGVTTLDIPSVIGLQRWLSSYEVEVAAKAIASGEDVVIIVTATDLDDAITRAAAIVKRERKRPRLLNGTLADQGVSSVISLLSTVRDEVPIVCCDDDGAVDIDPLAKHHGAVVLCSRVAPRIRVADRMVLSVAAGRSDLDSRVAMWNALLPANEELARQLAGVHRIEPGRATRALEDARTISRLTGEPADRELISRCLRQRATTSLPSSVHLVQPRADWDDLVLDETQKTMLAAATERARNQVRVLHEWSFERNRSGSSGVRILFTGSPGTGKTLAAEVLAKQLGLDLLVVDLASLVSKWLGETEKNLAAVFEAAERCQAVLFFDEADAIFARRTETSDAHARWANLETAYLLGRIEQFDGVAVLASNLRSNIDTAFLRRLEFVINFDDPDRDARERLWNEHLSPEAPLAEDVDLREMASLYTVTGGVIRNATLAAAFLAAAEDTPISQHHLATAMRREYEKAGRSFPGAPRRLLSDQPQSNSRPPQSNSRPRQSNSRPRQ